MGRCAIACCVAAIVLLFAVFVIGILIVIYPPSTNFKVDLALVQTPAVSLGSSQQGKTINVSFLARVIVFNPNYFNVQVASANLLLRANSSVLFQQVMPMSPVWDLVASSTSNATVPIKLVIDAGATVDAMVKCRSASAYPVTGSGSVRATTWFIPFYITYPFPDHDLQLPCAQINKVGQQLIKQL